jgi:hypothetical protein
MNVKAKLTMLIEGFEPDLSDDSAYFDVRSFGVLWDGTPVANQYTR